MDIRCPPHTLQILFEWFMLFMKAFEECDYPLPNTKRQLNKGNVFWHRGVLKPIDKHKNNIPKWRVKESQRQVLRTSHFILRYQ